MRDCICTMLSDIKDLDLDFDYIQNEYYKRAEHLVKEHKVKQFYLPFTLSYNKTFYHFLVSLVEIKFDYGIDIIFYASCEKDLELIKEEILIDGENELNFEFEIHDFLDVYESCQFKFNDTMDNLYYTENEIAYGKF